jgi:hypothetical protein
MFKNSVRAAKKTQHFTITKINWLMLFEEIIPVFTEPYETNKYKMQRYWLLQQVVHVTTTGL